MRTHGLFPGKLVMAFLLAIFSGFTIFKADDSINAMQQVFSIFLALFLMPAAADRNVALNLVHLFVCFFMPNDNHARFVSLCQSAWFEGVHSFHDLHILLLNEVLVWQTF